MRIPGFAPHVEMANGKQKLRPWLEEMITKGDIHGLCWLSKDKTKFRIPWKHGGKQDWSPDSSRIFMEWAKHTGKYREGVDKPNYPTWKTRLRCAFNKAPDIQELKAESQLNSHEPFRVYVLTQNKRKRSTSIKSSAERRKTTDVGRAEKRECQTEEEEEERNYDGECTFSPDTNEPFCSQGLVPTMVTEMESASPVRECQSPGNQSLPDPTEFFISDSNQQMLQSVTIGSLEELEIGCNFPTDEFTGETIFQFGKCLDTDLQMVMNDPTFLTICDKTASTSDSPQLNDYRVKMEIFYCGHPVGARECDIRSGMHLAVNGFEMSHTPSASQLSDNLQAFYLPRCQGLLSSAKAEKMVDHLLARSMLDGLVLWMDKDADIFASRFCPGAIFHISQIETNGEPVKIRPNREVTRIFSYSNSYKPEHDRYLRGQRLDAPDPTIYLTCGEAPAFERIPGKVFICIKLTPLGLLQPESQGAIVQMEGKDETELLFQVTNSIPSCSSDIPCDIETDADQEDDLSSNPEDDE